MIELTTTEWVLLATAAFVAMTTLVRLMQKRRDVILDELSQEAELEIRRRKLEEKKEKRRQIRNQVRRGAEHSTTRNG